MAITHSIKFTASAKAALSEIEKYEDQIVATAQTVDKYASALGGGKILAQANNWVAAVDKIGGATRLTGAEQEKVNKVLDQALAKYAALGKTAPSAMTELYNATKPIPKATEEVAASATKAESAFASIGKSAAGYLAGMATFATAQRVIGGTVEFLQASVAAAAEAEAAQSRLATAMRTNGVATEGNRQAFADLAAEMQRTTVYEDDQIVALEAMATQLGVLPSQMEGAVKAAANLASGLGIDLEQAMKMVVKANNESFTAFQKLGISIDETRAKAEGLPYVFAQINAGMGGQAAAEVETYAGQVAQLTNAWGELQKAIGGAVISLGSSSGAISEITSGLRGMNTVVGNLSENWGKLLWASRSGTMGVVQGLIDIGKAPPPKVDPKPITDGAMAMRQALDGVSASLDKLLAKPKDEAAKNLEAAGRAAKRAGDDFKKLKAEIYELEKRGAGASLEVWKFGRVLDEAGDTADVVKGLDEVAKKLYEIEKIGAGGDFKPWTFGQVIDEAGDVNDALKGMADSTKDHAAGVSKALDGAIDTMALLSRAAEMMGETTTAAMLSIGAAITQAFATGGAVSAWFAGVGTLLAMAQQGQQQAHQLWLKTQAEKEQRLQNAIAKYNVALSALSAGSQSQMLGLQLEELILTFMALRDATNNENLALAEMAGSIDEMVERYQAAGIAIPQELQVILADLGKIEVTQLRIADLQGQLAGRQVMDWKKAEEVIAKYGGTLSTLGAQFESAKQAASWKDIWDDWQTLIDMGADIGGVLVTMKDEIATLVQESQRIGTEIPEQFRPLIAELIRTGQLLDENGTAITDIGTLKFGAPVLSEVDKIVAAIQKLIDVLTGKNGVTEAFAQLGDIQIDPVEIPYRYKATNGIPGMETPEVDVPVPGYTRGTGGFVDFGRGTLAMLHGREAVVPIGQAGPGGSSAPITITVVSQLDGREVARNQVRYLPTQLTLAGR